MDEAKEAEQTFRIRVPRGGHGWRLGLFVAALALFALSAIAFFFLVYVPNERREAIAGWAAKLEAVANDRKAAIGERVDEILGGARTAASSPSVRAAVAAQRAGSAFVAADRLDEALGSLQSGRRFGGIALFGDGGVWLAGSGRWGSGKEVADVAALLRPEAAVDFVLGADAKPLIVFAAPVGGGKGARAVILVDPAEWFYPLLAREAVPTRTGEVFLARRDGEDVVVLSPLRARPDAPLMLRIPASGTTIAARFAAAGKEMAGEFPDYRGDPVVAAARLVPGTGWVVVAKVDRDEALESFRAKMRWAAALLSLSIVLGGLLAAALAHEAGNRSRRAAEVSDQRLALLVKEANDAILYSAADGRVLEANPRAEEIYGYSRAELLTMSLRDLRSPEGRVELDRQLAAIRAGARLVFETNGLRKDGTVVELELSVRGTSVEGKPGFISVIRDVSVRKKAERRIAVLNRLLRTHTAVNQLIIRERDQQRLLEGVCRAAVDEAGFRMAWVGLADRTTGVVHPVAVAGHDEGYVSEISVSCDDTMEGRGPTGTAIREGRRVTLDDMRDDPRFEPWREAASRRGYRSSAALPLVVDGEAIGALTVYSDERAAFTGEIGKLLEEMAGDLAFALQIAQSEEMHRKVEERYRLISENAADVIWTLDVSTLRFTYVSPSVKRLRGFMPEEVIGQPIESALTPESQRLVAEELSRRTAALEAGDESSRIGLTQVESPRRDGTTVSTEMVTTLLADEQGRVIQVLGVSRDITERKRAAEALRESEAELREAQRVAHVGSWSWVIETDTVTWSEELFRITGRDPAGTPPNYFEGHATVYIPESLARLQPLVERATRTGEPYEADLELIRPDGTARWVVATGEARRDANGQIVGLRGTVEDITEQRRLQEQLLHSQKMEAVGRLAGGIAHDFNNILTVIGGYSEMLLEALPEGEPAHRQATEIGLAAKRAAALTRQLLTFSRKQVLKLKVLDLNTIASSILGFLSRLLGEDIEIVLELQKDLGLVKADPGQIEQVITNLSVNARDAMPQGGKLILETQDVELDESYARAHPSVAAGPYVLLAASDTGCGMTPETVSHIFEPFFTTKEAGKGTGLGLSTVFGIVKQSGGEVGVYSVPGEGTTFKIYLPRVSAETGERDLAWSPSIIRARPDETVLMVEDDEAVGRLTQSMLGDLGYEVLAAARGEEALEIAAHHPRPIHLLLTDVVMPGVRGPEVANRLLALHPETRVVFMSGYAEEAVLHQMAVQGSAVFLQKPFTSSALGGKLREALDASPLPEQQGACVLPGRKPLSILHMDDDRDILEITRFFLAEDGHRVVGCVNVEETVARYAEALARGERFDLVILDLSIPGKKGGVEGMREILKLDPTARIVACSGAGPAEVGPLESGFISIVEKPFTSERLKAILHLL